MKLKELKLWNKFHGTADQKFHDYLKKHKDVDKALEAAEKDILGSETNDILESETNPNTKKQKLMKAGRWNFIKNKAIPLPFKSEPEAIHTATVPPVPTASNSPSLAPLQLTALFMVMLATTAVVGSPIT